MTTLDLAHFRHILRKQDRVGSTCPGVDVQLVKHIALPTHGRRRRDKTAFPVGLSVLPRLVREVVWLKNLENNEQGRERGEIHVQHPSGMRARLFASRELRTTKTRTTDRCFGWQISEQSRLGVVWCRQRHQAVTRARKPSEMLWTTHSGRRGGRWTSMSGGARRASGCGRKRRTVTSDGGDNRCHA